MSASNSQFVVVYYPGYSQQQVQQNLLVQAISSITNANPCVIITTVNHDYNVGMIVRFNIPSIFGMPQLNAITTQVIALTSNTLTINVDSTNFGVFAYPSPLPNAYTFPTVIPNSSGPYLPPQPLPYGNQDSFEGVIFNNGSPGELIQI